MSIDNFFHKKYNRELYNCAHFTCEVWQSLTGEIIAHKLTGLLEPSKYRYVSFGIRRHFEHLKKPESPSIILMQRYKNSSHVGVFVRGKVLHITERGVEFQPIDVVSQCFDKIGFYK